MFYPYPVKVFATTGSDELARQICAELRTRLPLRMQPKRGLRLSKHTVERFSNENMQVQCDNVRGRFVVVIHTQAPPVSEGLIELFHLLDAIENARPADVLLVFPYMPYARSDRKNRPRISVMGHCLPKIITTSFGVKRVILLDPHDSHTKHYFEPAADEISAIYLVADYISREFLPRWGRENSMIAFADAGSAKRYGQLAYLLRLPVAYIDKDRPDDTENPEFKKVVGDVDGKKCILVDDEILTGGTAIGDAEILRAGGAVSIAMTAIHPILADKRLSVEEVMDRLEDSIIERFIVTDTIPVRHKLRRRSKFVVLSVAPLLAEAISRTVQSESLTALHSFNNVKLYRP